MPWYYQIFSIDYQLFPGKSGVDLVNCAAKGATPDG